LEQKSLGQAAAAGLVLKGRAFLFSPYFFFKSLSDTKCKSGGACVAARPPGAYILVGSCCTGY
jgi:hypothetical protein